MKKSLMLSHNLASYMSYLKQFLFELIPDF